MRSLYGALLFLVFTLRVSTPGMCQESVFTGLKSDLKKADEYFRNESFVRALELYLAVAKTRKAPDDIALRIARTFNRLRESNKATVWFGTYVQTHQTLPLDDQLTYAEALKSIGKYDEALVWYKSYQDGKPQDENIADKIWRVKNIAYLYEDSVYFGVKAAPFNSTSSDFGPTYFGEGVVFVSNRKFNGPIQKVDGATNAPFYRLYYTKQSLDTTSGQSTFTRPVEFSKNIDIKFHQGTAAFFPGQQKMIYTKSVLSPGASGSVLMLFEAEYVNGTWSNEQPFIHNVENYSVSHPSLSPDGSTLYFASDMPGGYGGRDLYRCTYKDNTWSLPVNLGPQVNTAGDETFPFSHRENVLYFSSSGHGGFGGLDIFRIVSSGNGREEVHNLGYPVNTGFDDFGIVLNAEGTNGFFSSNRSEGPLDDNLFELEIDLQTYPLIISGTVRVKSPDQADTLELPPLGNAVLILIDNNTHAELSKVTSDESGRFTLEIPRASQYRIEVQAPSIGRKIVSLAIPRNRKQHTNYQIVVVQSLLDDTGPLTTPNTKKQ